MQPIRTINVTRYVTPLREGGSLPAIVEADDDGLYVLKFRGAGQGAGRCGRARRRGRSPGRSGCRCRRSCSLTSIRTSRGPSPTPRSTRSSTTAPASTSRSTSCRDRSPSIRSCSARPPIWPRASSGLMRFVTNVDRTARNTNMLMWHRRLWLIDHGATLYFHHSPGWESAAGRARGAVPGDQGSRSAAARDDVARRGRDAGGSLTERRSRRDPRGGSGCLAERRCRAVAAGRARGVSPLSRRPAGRRRGRFVEEAVACPLSSPTTTPSSASSPASNAASASTLA